jgi:predicted RNA-binding Zn ribbon-like protein
MNFAPDVEMSLAGLAVLVNTYDPTLGADAEKLTDIATLDAFLDTYRWTGPRTRDAAELAAVRALRDRLRTLWELPEEEVVDLVNALLREAGALPQLIKHDEWHYHFHATALDAPVPQRLAVEFAMAVADMVRQDELGRLRVCEAPDCEDVMIDLSRNRSRRFCDTTCANRVNVAAFRARRSRRA